MADRDVTIACSLDAAAVRDRVAQWHALTSSARDRAAIDGGMRLTFDADPVVAASIADLAVREQQCCPFFGFALTVEGGLVHLDVLAPDDAAPLVKGLLGPA